ncbi:hypothetical protein [Sphingobacterium sp. SYP-B4668]|uniref:hypothetical protein n=1 Tax=Sphingobacterium sp. SYP-B4668 TaxID=2996035 RepID=UPI0022DD5C13|nr:hypothetical protein [Sphingobacterium sp. SYP-B4668]
MAIFHLNDPTKPGLPSSYLPGPPSTPCAGNSQICTINATASGTVPVITEALRNEMLQALNTHANTANVILKA